MDNFNTHGGYFAPQGYTKVNEGGSHEENPNGGVQLGVDQNGIPNLLEEGEPVYKDFVYSDNIKADGKFLEQFGIPKKYADKFYSQIADAYIDEAETRPYDQISANGLNAMLGRLAEAQEAQKAAEEEAALMEELKNMSPEEIAAIQDALAQEAMPQEQMVPEEQIQPEVAPEMIAPEQIVPEQVMPEVPMMACGGKMNRYDGGGRKGRPIRKTLGTFFNGPQTWTAPDGKEYPINSSTGILGLLVSPGMEIAAISGAGKTVKGAKTVGNAVSRAAKGAVGEVKKAATVIGEAGGKVKSAAAEAAAAKKAAYEEAQIASEIASSYKSKAAKQLYDAVAESGKVPKEVAEAYKTTSKAASDAALGTIKPWINKAAANVGKGLSKVLPGKASAVAETTPQRATQTLNAAGEIVGETAKKNRFLRNLGIAGGVALATDTAMETGGVYNGPLSWAINSIANRTSAGDGSETIDTSSFVPTNTSTSPTATVVPDGFAKGGPMNLYLRGTDNLKRSPSWYPQSRTTWEFNPDWSAGRYLLADYDAPYGYVPAPTRSTSDVTVKPYYPYIQLPNASYDEWGQGRYLPDDTALYWGRMHSPSGEYFDRNFDDNPIAPTMLGEARVEAQEPTLLNEARITPPTARKSGYPGAQKAIMNMPAIPNLATDTDDDPELADIINSPIDSYVPGLANDVLPFQLDDTNIDIPELSRGLLRKAKWDKIKGKLGGFDTRLLSPLVDAAMGLSNLSTPADHYDFVPIRPYLPSGRIRQQYERYNPLDQNMVTNQMMAQANANMRALRNVGLGPSLGANLLASDYNSGLNLGNALTNVWDANNQRRNQVIAQNNQADAAIANFDWNVETARANALNQFAPYNQRMALQTQVLNNQAEQDKYNAVAASINSGKKFLNDYGWEMMNRNMVNSNRGLLGYGIDRMNNVVYDRNGNPILLAKCGGKINKKK